MHWRKWFYQQLKQEFSKHPRESFPTAVSMHDTFTEDTRIRILPWLLFSLASFSICSLVSDALAYFIISWECNSCVFKLWKTETLHRALGLINATCWSQIIVLYVEFSDVLFQEHLGARLQCLTLPWFFSLSLLSCILSPLLCPLHFPSHIYKFPLP